MRTKTFFTLISALVFLSGCYTTSGTYSGIVCSFGPGPMMMPPGPMMPRGMGMPVCPPQTFVKVWRQPPSPRVVSVPRPISGQVVINQTQNVQVVQNDPARLDALETEVNRLREQLAQNRQPSSSDRSDYSELKQEVETIKQKLVRQDQINSHVEDKLKRIDDALVAIGRAIQP